MLGVLVSAVTPRSTVREYHKINSTKDIVHGDRFTEIADYEGTVWQYNIDHIIYLRIEEMEEDDV